ncbi:UDP-N-acetylglucosamine 1-carboxyvinyltransferase [Desulfurobacterium sp.]
MHKFVIKGGQPLKGRVRISGSKNASLPIIFASILTERAVIENVPDLRDTRTAISLLMDMGFDARFSKNKLEVVRTGNVKTEADYELVRTMRASVLTLGPLLARFGKARVSLPGGCAIGARPVDLHLKALSRLGAEIKIEHGYINAVAPDGLKGAEVVFDFPTVGGTENLLMAAVLAKGKTVIRNAAKEPEIVDLARSLKKAGACIEGEGTDTIEVVGTDSIGEIEYAVMPDRIEAGTFIACVAAAGGEIVIEEFPGDTLEAVVDKFREAGVSVEKLGDGVVSVKRDGRLRGTDITTEVYPGFPTDMQAQFMAAMCLAEGVSVIRETIFENRFQHVLELQRLGADIKIDGNTAVVRGVDRLIGAKVMATDLRASASLVVAGLAAENTTEIYRIYHLERGYENLDRKLSELGAEIKKEKSEKPY